MKRTSDFLPNCRNAVPCPPARPTPAPPNRWRAWGTEPLCSVASGAPLDGAAGSQRSCSLCRGQWGFAALTHKGLPGTPPGDMGVFLPPPGLQSRKQESKVPELRQAWDTGGGQWERAR